MLMSFSMVVKKGRDHYLDNIGAALGTFVSIMQTQTLTNDSILAYLLTVDDRWRGSHDDR